MVPPLANCHSHAPSNLARIDAQKFRASIRAGQTIHGGGTRSHLGKGWWMVRTSRNVTTVMCLVDTTQRANPRVLHWLFWAIVLFTAACTQTRSGASTHSRPARLLRSHGRLLCVLDSGIVCRRIDRPADFEVFRVALPTSSILDFAHSETLVCALGANRHLWCRRWEGSWMLVTKDTVLFEAAQNHICFRSANRDVTCLGTNPCEFRVPTLQKHTLGSYWVLPHTSDATAAFSGAGTACSVNSARQLVCMRETGVFEGDFRGAYAGYCPESGVVLDRCGVSAASNFFACCGDTGRLRCVGALPWLDTAYPHRRFINSDFAFPFDVDELWTSDSALCAREGVRLRCWGRIGVPAPDGTGVWRGESLSSYRAGTQVSLLFRGICMSDNRGVMCAGLPPTGGPPQRDYPNFFSVLP